MASRSRFSATAARALLVASYDRWSARPDFAKLFLGFVIASILQTALQILDEPLLSPDLRRQCYCSTVEALASLGSPDLNYVRADWQRQPFELPPNAITILGVGIGTIAPTGNIIDPALLKSIERGEFRWPLETAIVNQSPLVTVITEKSIAWANTRGDESVGYFPANGVLARSLIDNRIGQAFEIVKTVDHGLIEFRAECDGKSAAGPAGFGNSRVLGRNPTTAMVEDLVCTAA